MRFAYLYIFKGVTRLLAVCTLLWAVASPLGAIETESLKGDAGRNTLEDRPRSPVIGTAAADGDVIAVGPGRVSLRLSPSGRWLALVPDWNAGESVVTAGGIVVMTVDEHGEVVELANTASGDGNRLRVRKETFALRPVQEGIAGGARYPLAHSDDDGDGRENEERLDGIDNDGDGRVDEDYAAVGDQMVALSFESLDGDGEPVLDVYQECYAWTLPHIDGTVAMKVTVRNASERTLEEVRIGTVVYRPVGFSVSTQDLEPPTTDQKRLASKGILLSEPEGTAVAVVFFAETVKEGTSWLTGVARPDRHLADLVQAFVAAERGPVADVPQVLDGDEDGTESERLFPNPKEPENTRSNDRMAYGVSPDLGSLAPGEEVVVYVSVLAIPSIERVDRAIDDTYRTMVGDGTHRMIPPLVSVRRQTVWGVYEIRHGADDYASTGVVIILANARGLGIGASDISYLTGVDITRAEIKETFDGNLELVFSGDLYRDFLGEGGRVELHGRLRNGEFFDVVLNPGGMDQRSERLSEVSESQYWSSPGRLDETLLAGTPNPFRESTTIFYEIPSSVSDDSGGVLSLINPVQTSVKIYNVTGRLVGVLVDTILSPGQYNTQWDALDDNGSAVASGVYYVKLQIGERHVTKRLIQLK